MGKVVYGFKNGKLLLSKKHGAKTESDDQQPDISNTPEQRRYNDFLCQIKEEKKSVL